MALVLFDMALIHLSRITRIMTLPSGHGVLIGNGGSGRKSLLSLASMIKDMRTVNIDLKKINKADFFCFYRAFLQ